MAEPEMKKSGAWVVFFLIAAWATAQPGPIRFEELPANIGLPRTTINSICQDHQGFLWFGSWSGLFRFDGHQLKSFRQGITNENGLESHKVTRVVEDSRQRLWVCTRNGGLYLLDRRTEHFTQFLARWPDPLSAPQNNVWDLFEDANGTLWAGTEAGLHHVNLDRRLLEPVTGAKEFVYDMTQSADGAYWLATENGLLRLESINLPKLTATAPQLISLSLVPRSSINDTYIADNYVYTVLASQKDTNLIWAGTKGGLKKIRLDSQTRQLVDIQHFAHQNQDPSSLSNNFVKGIWEQIQGNSWLLWVGTFEGLNRLDVHSGNIKGYFAEPGNPESLNNNSVSTLMQDRTGVLWIGTGAGVNYVSLNGKPFLNVRTAVNDNSNGGLVYAARQSSDGALWVSMLGAGLQRFEFEPGGTVKPGGQSYFFADPVEPDLTGYISDFERDHTGEFWLATQGSGVLRFDPAKVTGPAIRQYTQYTARDGYLRDDYTMAIREDADGNIWIGMWNSGVAVFHRKTGRFFTFTDASQGKDLTAFPNVALYPDQRGGKAVMWLGTRGGGLMLLSFDEQKQRLVQEAIYQHDLSNSQSLSNNFICDIEKDDAGRMWIGTENGLNLLGTDNASFRHFLETDGLPSDMIQGLAVDGQGALWISTASGISRLTGHKDQFVVRSYYQRDGIQDFSFVAGATYRTRDGQVLFGRSNGITLFRPESIRVDSVPPQVAITGIRLFNKPVPIGKPVNDRVILPNSLADGDTLRLTYRENVLSIEFVGMHFAQAGQVRYAYRLEGFDDDWVYASHDQRLAHYTNLPYKTLIFRVKAANSDGVWSEKPATLYIEVAPPFWLSGWAYGVYVLLFLGLLGGVRWITLSQAALRNRIALERIEREKVEEVSQVKLQFFTNISHELRTPLTLILTPLEDLIKEKAGDKRLRDTFARMFQNGTRLLTLINQLLDLRRSDAGLMRLKVAEGNIVKFIDEIVIAFQPMAAHEKVSLRLEAAENPVMVWYDRDQMEKVLFNLLSNALKFTPKGGRVTVSVQQRGKYCDIVVADTGAGIPSRDLPYVFDRFYQAPNQAMSRQGGAGIGLALAHSIVIAHRGEIQAESEEGKGAAFTVSLLLGAGHFKEEEKIADFRHSEHQSYFSLSPEYLTTEPDPAPETPAEAPVCRLLIVEDNADIRAYLRDSLSGQYLIDEAANGEQGWLLAQEHSPDLIISDIAMPGMDGIQLTRMVKTHIETSHIPVILLTARTSLIFQIDGLETGADDFVTKPFNMTLLKIRIRNLIRSREQLRERFVQGFDLNPTHVAVNSLDETFLKKVVKLVEDNMEVPDFSVEQLSEELGVSRMQMYRKLKALTGLSANHLIRHIRLKRAAQLLQTGQYTVAEVTYQVGFQDLKYFRERFKEEFGLSPSEYAGKQRDHTGED